MKKILWSAFTILLICFGLNLTAKKLDGNVSANSKRTLIIYNWGDYIKPSLLTKFEKQTGYHVIYETFDSNEAMYTKIQQGGTNYDLAVPSDYMISKLRKAHLLDRLDRRRLKNFKNIDPIFLHQSFDPKNNYSVPYFWGTLGIIYNDKFVKASEIQHWNDLWSPKFRHNILLVDSARDIMGLSLVSLGDSMNTTNSLDLKLAKTKLDELGPNIKAIVSDELKMYMIQNDAAIGVSWSGEAREMLDSNSHLHYVVPKEGSNLWFDNFVIPKTARHKKAAYAFLDFMLEPKNAAENAAYIGYATPNRAAKKLLPASLRNDRQFYPNQSAMKHLQVYRDLGPSKVQEYNDLFLEFKMYAH